MTHTDSNKRRECGGQGVANVVAALFGGMGGCAMIGQSVINVTSGGRGRLSTFVAGVTLLVLLAALGPIVGQIPMAALVAVMIMVSIGTFSWNSIPNIRHHPWPSSVVMLATVVVVVCDAQPRARRAGGRAAVGHLLHRQGAAHVHRASGCAKATPPTYHRHRPDLLRQRRPLLLRHRPRKPAWTTRQTTW